MFKHIALVQEVPSVKQARPGVLSAGCTLCHAALEAKQRSCVFLPFPSCECPFDQVFWDQSEDNGMSDKQACPLLNRSAFVCADRMPANLETWLLVPTKG